MSLIRADARAIPLIDGCVQTIVTSPPYWGQRRYEDPRQIGAEDLGGYLDAMLEVGAECWRVLRTDGTFWLNLGDKFANDSKWGGSSGYRNTADRAGTSGFRGRLRSGLKSKDLAGIPWTVALLLREAGWYLRRDVIWEKPNPPAESVEDRLVTSHEYLFLLTKSQDYYFDWKAITEAYAPSTIAEAEKDYHGQGRKDYAAAGVQNPSNVKRRIIESIRRGEGKRKGSVWRIKTQPYLDGDHYAAMPEALVEPCILAGSRPGDLVFDPFLGTGTVGQVSERLMRRWVGTDLSYQHLAKKRTRQRGLRLDQPA